MRMTRLCVVLTLLLLVTAANAQEDTVALNAIKKFQRELDAGDRGADAGVVSDLAGIILRHIEIGADEDAFVVEIEVGESEEFHGNKEKAHRSALALNRTI